MGRFLGLTCRVVRFECGNYPTGLVSSLRFVCGTHAGLGGLSAAHTQGLGVGLRHTRRAGRFVYGTHVGLGGLSAAHTQGLEV